jgi:MOSC domain-containing protein YiiM
MRACLGHDAQGQPIRKAGVMGIVRAGGAVRAGDDIAVILPTPPYLRLERV